MATENSWTEAQPSYEPDQTSESTEQGKATGEAHELGRDELDALIKFFLLLDAWDKKEKLLEGGKLIDNT